MSEPAGLPSSDPLPPPRSAWLAPLLVLGVALLLATVFLVSIARSVAARDREAFEGEVTRTTDAIRERVDTTVTLLRGVAGLFGGSTEVERQEFSDYVRQLQLRERYPGILGIGFSERILPANLARREAEARAAGPADFHVWPEEPRAEYHAILFLDPLDERNRAAIGYDMFTEPTRRAAMEQARDEGSAAASGPVTLVQEIDARKQAGFLIYLPIYHGGTVPRDLTSRRELLAGFAYAPLRVDDLLHGVRGTGVRQVDYELYDGDLPLPQALMRSTRERAGPAAFTATRRLVVAGRPWLIRFTSRPEFEALSQRGVLPWLGLISLGASLLLAWIVFLQARARRDAELAAAQRRRNELALEASEERAHDRAQRLQQLYAELRESDRRKDEFLAMLAHELRNPLAPIRSSLEILQRVPEGPRAQRAREIAQRQVSQMVRLVDDLLDVSRISRGKIVLQTERIPLARVLDTAVDASRPLIEAKGHELRVAPVDRALEIEVDPARIAQIVTNLLNNAANYTPAGGRIELRVEPGDMEVRITVRDNGIGIAPEHLQEIFQLFTQVNRSPAGGGLGIGLSLSARLAELHGGHIDARSEGAGRGSEFVLVLPRPAAGPRPAAEPAEEGAAQRS